MSDTPPIKLYTALLAAMRDTPVFGAVTGKMVQLGQRNKSVGALLETAADVSQRRYPMTSPQFSTPTPQKKTTRGSYTVQPVIDPATGCHNWPGATDGKGYGNLNRDGRVMRAYRWYWIQANGPIPEGLQLDHLCRNRRCCNPAHLELVTPAENTRRGNAPNMIAHRENRCRRGHDFTPENTLHRADGTRTCRICENAAQMRRYFARKAVQA